MTNHVLPVLGPLPAARFTRDDVEKLRDELDAKIKRGWSVGADGMRRKFTWKTAANVWTLVTSMTGDMVNAKRRELRTRADDPTSNVKPPDRGADKAKQFLFPSEFLQLVTCEKVPRRWRRAVALAVYTYTRDAELRVLEFGTDVDMAHGVIDITRAYNRRKPGQTKGTKTDTPRRFAVEPNLLPLLQALRDEKDGKGLVLKLPSERAMARNFRRWLWKANVRRTALHEGTPTSKNITWHDLRATGATWMAVRGDDPLKIKQRCGHASFATTEIYIREAESVREGFGEVFPALPAELLEPIGGGLAEVWQDPNLGSLIRENACLFSGVDGTRTRGLRRDRPAL
jgi:integrase